MACWAPLTAATPLWAGRAEVSAQGRPAPPRTPPVPSSAAKGGRSIPGRPGPEAGGAGPKLSSLQPLGRRPSAALRLELACSPRRRATRGDCGHGWEAQRTYLKSVPKYWKYTR